MCPASFILYPFPGLTHKKLITMDFDIFNVFWAVSRFSLKFSLFCWYAEKDVYGLTHFPTSPMHNKLALEQEEFLGIPEICPKVLFHHKVLGRKPKYIQNWKKQ